MTIREIAQNWIENADTTPEEITVETAAQYIEWMEDKPDGITPDLFADAWNSIVRGEN